MRAALIQSGSAAPLADNTRSFRSSFTVAGGLSTFTMSTTPLSRYFKIPLIVCACLRAALIQSGSAAPLADNTRSFRSSFTVTGGLSALAMSATPSSRYSEIPAIVCACLRAAPIQSGSAAPLASSFRSFRSSFTVDGGLSTLAMSTTPSSRYFKIPGIATASLRAFVIQKPNAAPWAINTPSFNCNVIVAGGFNLSLISISMRLSS